MPLARTYCKLRHTRSRISRLMIPMTSRKTAETEVPMILPTDLKVPKWRCNATAVAVTAIVASELLRLPDFADNGVRSARGVVKDWKRLRSTGADRAI